MTHTTVPLKSLLPPESNPRHHIDQSLIEGLAQSIRSDGLLQNLVVQPSRRRRFRIISGARRFFALKLLCEQGVIDGSFAVPVDIRETVTDTDTIRIATVENMQREALDPLDEADAFATLLANGTSIDDVSDQTGLSAQTVRRRLALANLCDEAKEALRTSAISIGIAEAMTLGSHEQQRMLLADCTDGGLTREEIREMLLSAKPSVAMAVFPVEQYTGSFTSDLFSNEATTYFDDIDQFLALQQSAVEEMAAKHRESAAWLDLLNVYSVPWWQYRAAADDEASGVVINLSPSGHVEIREGLARQELAVPVAPEAADTPAAPRERPPYSEPALRYAAIHKTITVQAALLADTRKAREVVAALLLQGFHPFGQVSLEVHACLSEMAGGTSRSTGYRAVEQHARSLAEKLGYEEWEGETEAASQWLTQSQRDPIATYALLKRLSDEELDDLTRLLVIFCFGQEALNRLETDASLLSEVARDLGVEMRTYWTPDKEFLSYFRRDQLETVVRECGAAWKLGKLSRYTKAKLVVALASYFERTADPSTELNKREMKGRDWLPQCMWFAQPAGTERS